MINFMNQEDEYEKLLKKVAKNIKRLRLNKGLTQENMVDFGFNYRHYQRIESGTYSPNLHTIFRLSKIFKSSMDEFFK